MQPDLSTIFERARVGRVVTVFSNDVHRAVGSVQRHAEDLAPVPTFVELDWEEAPELTRELREIASALAEAVRMVWPGWHRSASERYEHRRFPLAERELRLLEAQSAVPHLSAGWFRQAFAKCVQGEQPLVRDMPLAEQVHQLTLALDPVRPLFCLSVHSDKASDARIHGLARAAEWLAKQSRAPVLLFVPAVWQSRSSLDPVNYDALECFFEPLPCEVLVRVPSAADGYEASQNSLQPVNASQAVALSRATHDVSLLAVSPAPQLGPVVSVFPVPGKPHPKSDCEKLLVEHLRSDQELGPLFESNQRVFGFEEHAFCVDLLWDEGRLVVEVDGDEHRGFLKYRNDRERDYRLFLAGYVTLRVTNAEVAADCRQVLEKIRKMTQCRAHQQSLLLAHSQSSPHMRVTKEARSGRRKNSLTKRNSA